MNRSRTRNRSSTGTVRPGFCDLLMTAILPGTQPGDPDRKPDSLERVTMATLVEGVFVPMDHRGRIESLPPLR